MPRPIRSATPRAPRVAAAPRRTAPRRVPVGARRRKSRAGTGAAAAAARAPQSAMGAGERRAQYRDAAAVALPPYPAAAGGAPLAPGMEASFQAHYAHAVERAAPVTSLGSPALAAPEVQAEAEAVGWKRLLPARWGHFWPALRRGAAQVARRPRRELRMAEMLTLSEKRFLAVVRYGETQFLIGGAQNSIALLSRIEAPEAAAGRPVLFR